MALLLRSKDCQRLLLLLPYAYMEDELVFCLYGSGWLVAFLDLQGPSLVRFKFYIEFTVSVPLVK